MDLPEKETPPPSVPASEKGKRGGAADLKARADRYGTAKSHTQKLIRAIGPERAKNVGIPYGLCDQCGDWLKFRDYYTGPGIKLHAANFCKKTLVCSLCAIRRASRNLAAYLERFQVIKAKRPELRPYMATLTVRNRFDLAEALDHLLDSLRLLHKRRHNARQPSLMHEVEGGVFSVEVTFNPEKGWHPHVHAIWLCENEPSMYALRTEWEQITGDSFMCHIEPIKLLADAGPDIDVHAAGFAEVFKYAMKPSELGPDRLVEAYPILAGRRLLGSFGEFRGTVLPESLADDETGLEDLPYIEFMLHFVQGRYRLEESQSQSPPRTLGTQPQP